MNRLKCESDKTEQVHHYKTPSILFVILILFIQNCIGQQYNFDVYTIKNGLIQSNVTGIIQDTEGYLWFGTEGGISKFNGRSFTGYSTSNGLAESAIQGFAKDKKGRIWVAHTLGKVSVFEGGQFKRINLSKIIGDNRIQGIFADSSGFIWLCTIGKGAIRFNPDQPEQARVFSSSQGLNDVVYSGFEGRDGIIWFVTSIGIKTFQKTDASFQFFKPIGLPFYEYTCMTEDRRGDLWIGTKENGVIQLNREENKWKIWGTEHGLPSSFVTCIISRKDGSVACGTWKTSEHEGGIAIFREGILVGINRQKGLPGEKVYSLFEDREENLWIGLKNRGVAEFGGLGFLHLGKREGIQNEIINCVIQTRENQIWAGSDGGISIFEKKNGIVKLKRNIETGSDLGSNQVTDFEVLGEKLIVSSFIGDIGIYDSRNGKIIERISINKNYVNCLEIDPKNRLWIGSVDGLTIYDFKKNDFLMVEALEEKNTMAIKFDKEGSVWIGTRESGLYHGTDERNIERVSSFEHISPTSILITKENKVWIGTEGGGLYTGKSENQFSKYEGLKKNAEFISGITNSNSGIIIGSSIGFFQVKGESVRYYEENDGFIHPEIMLNSMTEASDGTIWFGTNNGITVYSPTKMRVNKEGPKILIESFQVFSRLLDAGKSTKLSYQENDITFTYSALTFKSRGKVRYKYILSGFDKEEQAETTSNQAHYTNLGPGVYTFKVFAKNSDDVWTSTPAVVQFEITPPFWRTTWFISLIILTTVAGIWGYVFFRTLYLRRAKVQLEEQVKERTLEIENKNQTLVEANKTISTKNKEITDSINYAKRIQESTLPNPADLKRIFPDSFIFYKPKDIVSGDFYWFKEEEGQDGKKGRVFLAVADCTGHGVPGAFMCMIGSSLLNQIIQENPGIKPAGVLHLLDKGVQYSLKQNETDTKDGMDIALCVFDPEKQTMEFSGAMRPMYLVRKMGQNEFVLNEIKPDKESIGGHKTNDVKVFSNHAITLQEGDCIYFSTDGFPDQFGGEKGKKLMSRKFRELLLQDASSPMPKQEIQLRQFWENWSTGYDQVDDVLVVGLKFENIHERRNNL
jgi:ligand-binding sensor domain-containing protein/serine phosphatase RsbU (regulator of sigma subunit)